MADNIEELHNEIVSEKGKINRCLNDNIQVLRDIGVSEVELNKLISTVSQSVSSAPTLPTVPETAKTVNFPLDLRNEMNHIISPQRTGETDGEFEQRVLKTVNRKRQASAAFSNQQPDARAGQQPTHPVNKGQRNPKSNAVPGYKPTSAMRAARFEDIGSTSTARLHREPAHRIIQGLDLRIYGHP
ncbi:hypothetical protein C8R43DRAFT_1118056 [Mycena crocata]|nr:hypothetical protein C8R43DRAFT_1118056 [Mycena crocata]